MKEPPEVSPNTSASDSSEKSSVFGNDPKKTWSLCFGRQYCRHIYKRDFQRLWGSFARSPSLQAWIQNAAEKLPGKFPGGASSLCTLLGGLGQPRLVLQQSIPPTAMTGEQWWQRGLPRGTELLLLDLQTQQMQRASTCWALRGWDQCQRPRRPIPSKPLILAKKNWRVGDPPKDTQCSRALKSRSKDEFPQFPSRIFFSHWEIKT